MAMPLWIDVDMDIIRKLLKVIGGDGHSILPKDFYMEIGVPSHLLSPLERIFESDFSHPKSTIFNNKGEPVEKMRGIKTADVIGAMADSFPCDPELVEEARGKMGRTACAIGLTEAINQVVDKSVI